METLKKYIQHNTECKKLFKELYEQSIKVFMGDRIYIHRYLSDHFLDIYYSIYSFSSKEGRLFVTLNKYTVKNDQLIGMEGNITKDLTEIIGEVITEEEFNNVINNLYMY